MNNQHLFILLNECTVYGNTHFSRVADWPLCQIFDEHTHMRMGNHTDYITGLKYFKLWQFLPIQFFILSELVSIWDILCWYPPVLLSSPFAHTHNPPHWHPTLRAFLPRCTSQLLPNKVIHWGPCTHNHAVMDAPEWPHWAQYCSASWACIFMTLQVILLIFIPMCTRCMYTL